MGGIAAKIGGGLLLLAALGLTFFFYGRAQFKAGRLAERVEWKDIVADHERKVADLRVANERRQVAAVETYAARISEIHPIVLRSTETVTRYAQTPAGRTLCLAPDRVLGIEQDRAALFPGYPIAAEQGPRVLPPNATPNR